ncbi:MAG: tetratricopeptide repeat protein [Crocinitomicaceae bacterium]
MRKIIFVFLLFVGHSLWAQSSDKYNSVYAPFYRGEELFLKEQYGAARKEFHDFTENFKQSNDPLYVKARYYEGLSALELYQNDGVQLLEEFNKNYPESIYKNLIFFRLGKYFYQKKKYEEVIYWFNQLPVSEVPIEDRDEFYFKLGYANFDLSKMVEARSAFHEVKDSPSQYGPPSLYYYSHIAYLFGSYQTALDGFEKLQSDPKFSSITPYYIAQIYYLQGRYADVAKLAPSLTDSVNVANEKDINLLIGDAYYRVGKYDEAVPYLEKYNAKSKTTRQEDYCLAYCYYQSKSYNKAIQFFDKTTKVEDTLAQVALYQIGECYLSLKQPVPARASFEQAASLSFRSDVKEDALYQFAVLSYQLDLNPYDEAVVALERYLNEYPNSLRKNDIYQYLVNCYTTTNNYGKALTSLDKIPNKDIRLKSVYQIISFNAGVEQYQKANYDEAIRLFGLVDKYPIDNVMSGKAKFWSADANYQKKTYRTAIQEYRAFLASSGIADAQLKADAYYNIGYANLILRDTLQAIESFKLYTQQSGIPNKQKLADAYMRIGDGYYSIRQNDPAVQAYLNALAQKAGYEDQALFYLGKTYGYMDKDRSNDKIKALLDIVNNYPKSKYLQVSIQEIAATYKGMSQYNQALKYYEQIISDYPNSLVVKEAMIEIADIYYKKQDYARSESEYKKTLAKYSNDRLICEAGGKGLLDVYRAMKQPEKLQAVVEQYPCANLTSDDQEELYYSPAFELYRDSNFTLAIPQIQKYLDKYPTGKYSPEMKIFLGNCYEKTGDEPQAMRIYQEALQGGNNGYTEFAALKVSKYLYNGGKYSEALPYYRKLEEVSSKPEIIFNARLGIMRASFLVENWLDAATYADKILNSTQINTAIRLEAEYAKGMSLYRLHDFAGALPSLTWISKNTTTIMGAEAKYTIAELYFQQNDFTNSDKEIRAIQKMKPIYNYWVAKALLLETKILMVKPDLVQAEQTLKSVMDNYPVSDDGILDEADVLWAELMVLKNPEKNIDPQNKPIIELNGGN